MKKPSYAPLYAAIYPELSELFRKHGYALAIHGSLQRDFDLIGVPWIETPSQPETVVEEIVNDFGGKNIGGLEIKLHGRLTYQIAIQFGNCYLDLSFMIPRFNQLSNDDAINLVKESPCFAAEALVTAIADSEYFQAECKALRN